MYNSRMLASLPERTLTERVLETPVDRIPFRVIIDKENDTLELLYGKETGLRTILSIRSVFTLSLICKGKALPIRSKAVYSFQDAKNELFGGRSSQRRIVSYLAAVMVDLGYAEYINNHKALAFL